MILRNHTMVSLLKNKMSPSGDVLVHNVFLGNKGMHYVVNQKHAWLIGTVLLFCYQEGQAARGE